MKELFLKNKVLILSITVALLAVTAIIVAGAALRDDTPSSHCKDTYGETHTTEPVTFSPNAAVQASHGGEIAFLLNSWCNVIPDHEKLCRCKLVVSSLSFSGFPSSLLGQTATVYFSIPNGPNSWTEAHDFTFAASVNTEGWELEIYEGTEMWIDFHELTVVPDFLMVPGSLCIVENVDGGDPGEDFIRAKTF
jgi:hypothetical protein